LPKFRPGPPHLRLGLRYARGLREESARAILRARPFTSIDDLALRVPELRKDEINRLAEIGALNSLDQIHRRDALWRARRAVLPVGPLLEKLEEKGEPSPLARMNVQERLWADYSVMRAADLTGVPNGRLVRIAGSVIVRQRPGTAKGFVFLSIEDETGIMNAILDPGAFERYKVEVLSERFLMIHGVLQNVDGVISVKAGRVEPLGEGAAPESHDFH
jgi:error-prone DNA polymerase